MSFSADRYWSQVAERNPGKSSDRSWKCLCCKDSGIVDDSLLRKYYPGQSGRNPSDAGARCQRPGCGEGTKYPGYALNRGVSPEVCQWLHEQDAEARLQSPPDREAVLARVRHGLEQIAGLPAAERDLANDPILARDPDSPYFQGEEVDF